MRKEILSVALVVLALLGCATAWGQEHLEASARMISPRPLTSYIVIPQARAVATIERPTHVQMTEVRADVKILEQVAATTLTISLRNPTPQRLEAELLVPVPDGAAVRSFTFQGSAAEPTAELLPKGEARRLYDSIVAKVRDPALLEFVGYRLIRSSVFPVEPNGTQKVQLTYENLLVADGNRVDYVLPRSESLEYGVPWHITVSIQSKREVSTVYSPSHRLEVTRPAPNRIAARLTPDAAGEPGAFRLAYLLENDGLTASLLAYPDPKVGGGYFLLLAGLPAKPEAEPGAKPMPREVTLVLDRSGSMNGEKIQQVREAALQIVAGLEPGEYFNIIPYNEAVDVYAKAPVAKNAESEKTAREYIAGIQARGGTNIHDALLEALRQKPSPGALPLVLFLTDGLPTVGQTAESVIRELAVRANPHQRRIFTFGVGVDVNTPLLDRLADSTRATATFVLPKENVEVKVGQVFRRLNGPVLASPELQTITADGAAMPGRTRDLLPSRLPDLFEGDQLVLLGQYVGEAPLGFQLAGNYLGKKREFRFMFDLDKATTRNAFVPRLWASRKIGVLIDAIRAAGADSAVFRTQAQVAQVQDPRIKELIDEVVRLSQEFGILTEYTAFLAREGTDLSDYKGNFDQANARFKYRAQGQRQGWSSLSQDANVQNYRGQSTLNYANAMNHGDDRTARIPIVPGSVEWAGTPNVQFSNVQQANDSAFFNNGGQWMDSRVAARKDNRQPQRVIEFGSEEFQKLVVKLADQGRQSSIALRGEILLEVDKEVVLVRNPLVPTDIAAASPAEAKRMQATARRAESSAAEEQMEAEE